MLGLGQVEFAERAHIKQSQVSQIETGTREITEAIYASLEHHLGANRAWIENLEGEPFARPIERAPAKDRDHDQRIQVQRLRSGLKNINMQAQAERLRYFREQEGITAEQLASELNVSTSTLNKYENGKLYLPVEVFVYLHDKFHMSYEWAFSNQGSRKTARGARAMPALTLEDLYETQTVLVAKLDYLQKELKIEQEHRKRLQRQIAAGK